MAFVGQLPSEVQLANYVAINDSVVDVGRLTDDEIISAALRGTDEASDEDPRDVLRPVRRTAKEVADALVVPGQFATMFQAIPFSAGRIGRWPKLAISTQLSARKTNKQAPRILSQIKDYEQDN